MELYEVLEVEQSASADAIKRAYRRLALKHHPDKNDGDDATFKRITHAHEVLADPGARALYDLGGHRDGNHGCPHDDEDQVEITLSPDEVRRGGVKRVELELLRACEACGATGATGGELLTCLHCGGDGCRSCAGRGAIPRPGRECKSCRGERQAYLPRAFSVRVPSGVKDGHRHVLAGKGGYDAKTGKHKDLVLLFSCQCEEHITVSLTLTELLCGFTREMGEGITLVSSGYFDPVNTKVSVSGRVFSFNIVYPTEPTGIARFTPAFQKMWKTTGTPPSPGQRVVVSVQDTPPP
jgi:molecular chaperone DnaJ